MSKRNILYGIIKHGHTTPYLTVRWPPYNPSSKRDKKLQGTSGLTAVLHAHANSRKHKPRG